MMDAEALAETAKIITVTIPLPGATLEGAFGVVDGGTDEVGGMTATASETVVLH